MEECSYCNKESDSYIRCCPSCEDQIETEQDDKDFNYIRIIEVLEEVKSHIEDRPSHFNVYLYGKIEAILNTIGEE